MNRNKKEKQYKEYLSLERQLDDIYNTINNLEKIKLNKPLLIGYEYYLVLRNDIARSKKGKIYQHILNTKGVTVFHTNKLSLNLFKNYNPITHYNKWLSLSKPYIDSVDYCIGDKNKDYNNWKNYLKFLPTNSFNYSGKIWYKYHFDIPHYYYYVKRRKKYITELTLHDEVLEQKKSFIERRLKYHPAKNFKYNVPKWYRKIFTKRNRRLVNMTNQKLLNGEEVEYKVYKNDYW